MTFFVQFRAPACAASIQRGSLLRLRNEDLLKGIPSSTGNLCSASCSRAHTRRYLEEFVAAVQIEIADGVRLVALHALA